VPNKETSNCCDDDEELELEEGELDLVCDDLEPLMMKGDISSYNRGLSI
jgi:hypothetical protein